MIAACEVLLALGRDATSGIANSGPLHGAEERAASLEHARVQLPVSPLSRKEDHDYDN